MSDYVTELRREVVAAHAQHRTAAARTRRRRRGPQLAWAVAVAALLVAAVVAVRSIPQPDRSAEPRVVKVVHIGGDPVDGAYGAGSLWVSDFEHSQVLRIDPRTRRVVARIPLEEPADDLAADDGSVWARGYLTHPRSRMWRIDPRTNRVALRTDDGERLMLAMAGGSVWVFHELVQPPTIDRVSPAGRLTARIPFFRGSALAGAGRWLWAVAADGTVARIDAAAARIEHRWPLAVPQTAVGDPSEAIAADDDGAWIIAADKGQIVRFEGDRIVRVLRIDDQVRPIMAATGGDLWVVAGDDLTSSRIVRYDQRTGKLTATVELGTSSPRALVPAPGGLWVVAGDGTVVLVAE